MKQETTTSALSFDTPAYQGQKDFNGQPAAQMDQFLLAWNNYVKYCTLNSQMGNPWSSTYDHPRSWYYNPQDEPSSTPIQTNTQPIQWFAFPNRINFYFAPLFQKTFPDDYNDKLHELADIGPLAFSAKYNLNLSVPSNPCNPDPAQTKPFGPSGPRGWQDEYCEWSVTRDSDGNITAVDFTHENPEYWFHLWRVDPDLVLSLYKTILNNENVQMEDLYLLDENGSPVIVRETGKAAYNPINKWNSGSVATPGSGGAVHLTSPPNSLGAEIYLGAAATILRKVNGTILTDPTELICAAAYGQLHRNSDPRIGQQVNLLVQKKVQLSLTNPIALYGQKPNFNQFQLPASANKTIEECYTIVRGADKNSGSTYYPNNMILHSRFAVPEGANFTLSDIQVNHVPLKWGSQIADTFQVQLAGTVIPPKTGQQLEIFPPVGNLSPGLPNVQYLLDANLLQASLYNKLNILSNLTSTITQIEQGVPTGNIAILTSGANKDVTFNFGSGISTITDSYTDLGGGSQLFIVTITADASATLGEKPLSLKNNPTDDEYPTYGVLEVVAQGTLAVSNNASPATIAISPENVSHLKSIL